MNISFFSETKRCLICFFPDEWLAVVITYGNRREQFVFKPDHPLHFVKMGIYNDTQVRKFIFEKKIKKIIWYFSRFPKKGSS